ncbi:MAG TPA: EamA family transporter [Syntrophorhabdales bacterium]|nr:EamA family transporter [Syntrophorhabdales bacterium]
MRRDVTANCGAFIAAILFGASVVAVRVAVRDIPPLTLAILRFGQGGLLLLLLLLIRARDFLRIKGRDVPYLLLLGAIFFTIFPVTFNMSLRLTEASRGALMLATMPLWSVLLARAAKKERLSTRQMCGVLLTFAGVGIVLAERGLTFGGTRLSLAGDALMLVTALCGAVYGVLAKRMLTRYNALTVTAYTMMFGTLLLVPAGFFEDPSSAMARMRADTLMLVLFLGIFGGAVGYFLWTFALTRLSPTQVAVYVNLNPMVATLLGATLLAEKLTGTFIAGFVAVLGGVLLVNLRGRSQVERHQMTN